MAEKRLQKSDRKVVGQGDKVQIKGQDSKIKGQKARQDPPSDMGIVIVDDEIEIDQEKVNEERRAYLEEARSQEAFD